MLDGVLCPACASAAAQPAEPDDQPLTYGWAKVQAGLLILSVVRSLATENTAEFSLLDPLVNGALAACILRRNKLILPLTGIAVVIAVLGIIGMMLAGRYNEVGHLAVVFVIGSLYAVYYYQRRHEFKRWL